MSDEKCLYVDDLALFYSAKATPTDLRKVHSAIDKLVENANVIDFLFSATKTTCLHFCRKKRTHPNPVLTIYGVRLDFRPVIEFQKISAPKF